jgi:hypothetical protein
MSLPSTNTNNITVSAPGSIPTPAAGYVTYFFNTADANRLYYKDDAGNVYLADEDVPGMESCVCNILCGTAATWNKALLAGVVTPTEYGTLLTNGFQVSTPQGVYSISNKV